MINNISKGISILYEYSWLETCSSLMHYVSFLRHLQSDRRSDLIKAFLWPALMRNSHFLFQAIVAT
uniref:Mitochondria-eating protein C-terminal domain-containing protein n=1 Tax=Glossina morsitans morsitans TaxID=37546 RepID=A0A1B0G9R8_GLOMM